MSELHEILKKMEIPRNENLFLHVKLKDIDIDLSYSQLAQDIINSLTELYNPNTIHIPSYTYSFTKTREYDKVLTPSEVGRFGEEIRKTFDHTYRSDNPVFNVVDTHKKFITNVNDETAFGENSLFDKLADEGYVMINFNLPVIRPAHLHYIEWKNKVPYRFVKYFRGSLYIDGELHKNINYKYYVRDLNEDPQWDREKIKKYLLDNGVLKLGGYTNYNLWWLHSKDMDELLNPKLKQNPRFLIKGGGE